MAKKRFTSNEIELLKNNPNVKDVREDRLTLTYEFRCLLWEAWNAGDKLEAVLKVGGIDRKTVGSLFIKNLAINFKHNGYPSGGKNKKFGKTTGYRNTAEDLNALLDSGCFVKNRNGISFHPDFIQELFHNYPDECIEDGLISRGIDPDIVGYQRIYHLKKIFEGDGEASAPQSFNKETIQTLRNHPYVKRITEKQFVLNEAFYEEATNFREFHIDRILDIFDIDYRLLPIMTKYRINCRIRNHKHTGKSSLNTEDTEQLFLIEKKKQEALKELIEANFGKCRECVRFLSNRKRKELCCLIQQLPHDDTGEYTVRRILSETGISKTSYYDILKNKDYGKHEEEKEKQDQQDIALIREIAEYKGYPKGSRMITMMMPRLSDKRFSRGKVIRLMRKGNISSGIRKASNNRRAMKELLEQNVKENRLKRRFRFERPLMNILTDVSYLFYGDNQKAYLSCLKDASSGRILGVQISSRNDEQLADSTLNELRGYGLPEGAMIHSDQGILYLSSHFQRQVEEMGMGQSMSRRGNCWDNAPQESFFGHFKDEVDYSDCRDVEEISEMVRSYVKYYNEERPQWTRMKKTPDEYEAYLNDMSVGEFALYKAREEQKYAEMMKKAAAKAKKRAGDIGAAA